jgi:hypothetical protein
MRKSNAARLCGAWAVVTVLGTATAAELKLVSTELTLADGRKVQGQLACELEDRLVLYSPNLGSLASFRKEFVAGYTRDAEVVQVSKPRDLTPEERNAKLDWAGWPDMAPATGPKPAYTTQRWAPPKRLLVWRKLDGGPRNGSYVRWGRGQGDDEKPGVVSCRLARRVDAANWLVLGEPLEGGKWDAETDVLLPGVDLDKSYLVQSQDRIVFRHLVAENHALLHSGHGGMTIHGNLWIHERGRCQENSVADTTFVGTRHTFVKNGRPPVGGFCRNLPFRVDEHGKVFRNITWDPHGYRLSQYIMVNREKDASVEFLGSFVSGDKMFIYSGTMIAGPDSEIISDTRNGDWVAKGATLHLLDGAVWGKRRAHSQGCSMPIDGTLTAGMPGRPLTRDATIILPRKVYQPDSDSCGLRVSPGGTMRVYSADPVKARLVIRYSGSDPDPEYTVAMDAKRWQAVPRRIDVVFLGNVVLDGVVFEDLYRGGIRLRDGGMVDSWKNITFGPSCRSQKPEDNYAIYRKGDPPAGWREGPAVKTIERP